MINQIWVLGSDLLTRFSSAPRQIVIPVLLFSFEPWQHIMQLVVVDEEQVHPHGIGKHASLSKSGGHTKAVVVKKQQRQGQC